RQIRAARWRRLCRAGGAGTDAGHPYVGRMAAASFGATFAEGCHDRHPAKNEKCGAIVGRSTQRTARKRGSRPHQLIDSPIGDANMTAHSLAITSKLGSPVK